MVEKNSEDNIDSFVIVLIVAVLIIELAFLGVLYFGADEVDCNLLWCEFKTSRRTIENNTIISSNSIITHNSECYQNGIKINCSEIPTYEDFVNMQEAKKAREYVSYGDGVGKTVLIQKEEVSSNG